MIKQQLIDLVGEHDANLFIEHYKGAQEYIHVGKPKPFKEISNQSWARICWAFNGEELYIGKGDIHKGRNAVIYGMHKDGVGKREIAKMHHITVRHVYVILSKMKEINQ